MMFDFCVGLFLGDCLLWVKEFQLSYFLSFSLSYGHFSPN